MELAKFKSIKLQLDINIHIVVNIITQSLKVGLEVSRHLPKFYVYTVVNIITASLKVGLEVSRHLPKFYVYTVVNIITASLKVGF